MLPGGLFSRCAGHEGAEVVSHVVDAAIDVVDPLVDGGDLARDHLGESPVRLDVLPGDVDPKIVEPLVDVDLEIGKLLVDVVLEPLVDLPEPLVDLLEPRF